MSTRIRTGIEGLDTILGGGFLPYNSVLLKGAPGTGKTSLGIQILLQGIGEEGEGAIVCSFEQFPQQLQRDMNSFGWDLDRLVADGKMHVFYVRPDDLVVPAGGAHSSLVSRVLEKTDEIGAKRLLMDSLSHFNRVNEDPIQCRSLILQFINEVKAVGLTPLLTAELHDTGRREFSFEEYLVDEVVLLHNDLATSGASLPQRTLEVTKTRGHSHIRGRHPFTFTGKGIEVYPHILPEPFSTDEMTERQFEPVPSGVDGVDRLLGGGYPSGTASIIAGMSGAYKTTLAATFLAEGAGRGENGLFITFEENPQQLIKTLARRGVDLASAVESGQVQIRHYVPKRTCLEKILADLRPGLDNGSLRRVVIDSLDDFERCIEKPSAYKDYLGMFLAALRRAGATTRLTLKLQQVSGTNPISDIRYVSMVETVVYLGNVEIESEIHRVISILKARGSRAEGDLREIQCDAGGLKITHKFHGLSGILQGTARGRFKKTVEDIFQPLYFIRDFAQLGATGKVDDAKRQKILADILSQLGALDGALKDYFGFDPEEEKKK
ncbi:MAG TPA: ATPase domain-containing protein [Sumerlaeia bacterium]|nr:ATPase domain-containing protein [Sumerlaeia bacterium]